MVRCAGRQVRAQGAFGGGVRGCWAMAECGGLRWQLVTLAVGYRAAVARE